MTADTRSFAELQALRYGDPGDGKTAEQIQTATARAAGFSTPAEIRAAGAVRWRTRKAAGQENVNQNLKTISNRFTSELLAVQWDTTVIACAAEATYATLIYRARVTGRTTFGEQEIPQAISQYLAAHPLPFDPGDATWVHGKMADPGHQRKILRYLDQAGLITRYGPRRSRKIRLIAPAPARGGRPGWGYERSPAHPCFPCRGQDSGPDWQVVDDKLVPAGRRLKVGEQLELARRAFAMLLKRGPDAPGDLRVAALLNTLKPDDVMPFSLHQARRLRLRLIDLGELHITRDARVDVDADTGRWTSTAVEISAVPPAEPPKLRARKRRSADRGIKRITAWRKQRHFRPDPGEPAVRMLAPFDTSPPDTP
jgi:hypothetical protein